MDTTGEADPNRAPSGANGGKRKILPSFKSPSLQRESLVSSVLTPPPQPDEVDAATTAFRAVRQTGPPQGGGREEKAVEGRAEDDDEEGVEEVEEEAEEEGDGVMGNACDMSPSERDYEVSLPGGQLRRPTHRAGHKGQRAQGDEHGHPAPRSKLVRDQLHTRMSASTSSLVDSALGQKQVLRESDGLHRRAAIDGDGAEAHARKHGKFMQSEGHGTPRHHSHRPHHHRTQRHHDQQEKRPKVRTARQHTDLVMPNPKMIPQMKRLVREYEDVMQKASTWSSSRDVRTPDSEADHDGRDDGDMSLLVAHTALILTFSWEDPRTEAAAWEELLLQRKIPSKTGGKSIPLWEVNDTLPMEVGELTPQFRKRLGWKEHHPDQNGHNLDVWRSRSLKITEEAKSQLFASAKICALQTVADGERGEEVSMELEYQVPKARKLRHHPKRSSIACDLDITDVQVILYPLGTGLLVLEIDWLPPNPSGLLHGVSSIDELRTWLFLSKFRHRVENVLEGWTFPNPEGLEDDRDEAHRSDPEDGIEEDHVEDQDSVNSETVQKINADEAERMQQQREKERKKEKRRRKKLKKARDRHLRSLGRMAGAVYGEEPITLGALGNWLVHLPDENPSNPPPRINRGQRSHHHSTIVLKSAPNQQMLSEYLFHLRRGFGQLNRPPPEGMDYGRDKVLVHRKNRYIGLSREGTVCISWPTSTENHFFDVNTWPKLFQGIYLVLGLQAHAENAVLTELGYLSMGQADMLRTDISFDEMEKYRMRLRELAAMMVRYTLSMSSDDCGGRSEYAHFFSDLRHVLGTPSAKQEIREQIDDVLGIIESQYMEEQKKIKRREMLERMEQLVRKREAEKRKEVKRRRFEIAIAAVTAITLPVLIVASLFGMNVEGIPDYDFWPLVGVLAGACSALLVLLLFVWWLFFRNKNKSKGTKKRIKKSLVDLPGRSTELVRKSFDWHPRSRFSMGARPSEEGHARPDHHVPTTSVDLRRSEEVVHRDSFTMDNAHKRNLWKEWKWGI